MNRRPQPPGRKKPATAAFSATAAAETNLQRRDERRLVWGVGLFLAAITWAVFGQTLHFDFVNYNDDIYVYDNPVVAKGLSLSAVGWAFTHAQVANWIPLTTLSHMLDCQLFGLHPSGHHLVSVLLHTASAVLLFLVLRQMTGRLWCAGFAAAVFAVHPLRAESVAWVSERKDVLSAFFFMLTIGAYVRQVRQPSRAGQIAVILVFALGLLAKSMMATLPCVLLLLDYWPLRRCGSRSEFCLRAREKIPLFILSIGACIAAVLAPGLVITGMQRLPFTERLGNSLVSCANYLRQMVFPAGLAIPYPYSRALPAWEIGVALAVLIAISIWAVLNWKKRPYLAVGWLWYLVMLLPVSEIIQINQEAAHADRYTYLPGIGLLIAGTWAVADWSANWKQRRIILGVLIIGIIVALTICGQRQTSHWKNSEALWNRALACTSGNFIACVNLGADLVQHDRFDEGIAQYQKALAIKPDFTDARNNLGVALFAKGDLAGAITQYQTILDSEPANAVAGNNLGNALVKAGQTDAGIGQYQKVLDLQAGDENARYNLGAALFIKGDLAGAITQYRQALEIRPDDAPARNNLGLALLRLGDADFQQGKMKPAADFWQQALSVNPSQIDAQNNLAWLLATTTEGSLRDTAKAVALAEQAQAETGARNPVILRTLAVAYAGVGRYSEAVHTARTAATLALQQTNNDLAATLEPEIKYYEARQSGK